MQKHVPITKIGELKPEKGFRDARKLLNPTPWLMTIALWLLCTATYAQKTWTGAMSSNWATVANWLDGGVPAAAVPQPGEIVIIPAATPVCNVAPASQGGFLIVDNGANLNIGDNTLTLDIGIQNDGSIVINNGILITPDFANLSTGNFTMTSTIGVVRVEGNWTNDGNFTVSACIPAGPSVIFEGNSNTTISGASTTDFCSLTIDKVSSSDQVIFSVPATALNTLFIRQGYIRVQSTLDVENLDISTGDSDIEITGSFITQNVNMSSGTATLSSLSNLQVQQNWTQNGGSFTSANNNVLTKVTFNGTLNSLLSGSSVNIEANVNVVKTGVSPNNRVYTPNTGGSGLIVGSAAKNRNLNVSSGQFRIEGVEPIQVSGNINITNTGVIHAEGGTVSIFLTGDWNSNAITDPSPITNPTGPFTKGGGLSASQVVFQGSSSVNIRPSANTKFDEIVINKTGIATVTQLLSRFYIERNLIITDGLLYINNVVNTSTLTPSADGLTSINVPDADLYVGYSVIISNGAGLNLRTNEPAGANTIAMHVGRNINDSNLGDLSATVGLYVCDPVVTADIDNTNLPTVVLVGTDNQVLTGNAKIRGIASPNLGITGMYLPNLFITKLDNIDDIITIGGNRALRVHGDMTILKGTFESNGGRLLFGNQRRADNRQDELLVYGILRLNNGSRLDLCTGGDANGTFLKGMRGGLVQFLGTDIAPIAVERDGAPGQYYRIEIQPGCDVEAIYANFNYQGTSNSGYYTSGYTNEFLESQGGFKVHYGATVNNSASTSTIGGFPVEHNFSYCSFAQGATGYTALTINTGQELTIEGARFTGSSNYVNDRNIVANPRNNCDGVSAAGQCGELIMLYCTGAIGGQNGEFFDGGTNDINTSPSIDRIIWQNFRPMYWVGNYNGSIFAPTAAELAAVEAVSADVDTHGSAFRKGAEAHSGSTTDWANWKNWSVSNLAFHNPGQVFPGQTNVATATVIANYTAPSTGTVPADTLKQFDVFITRTATSQPTLSQNLEVQGSIIVNSGIVEEGATVYTATNGATVINRRMIRFDIYRQVANAHTVTAGTPYKIFTLAGTNVLTVGGSFAVETQGQFLTDRGHVKIYGNLGAFTTNSVFSFLPEDALDANLGIVTLNGIGGQEVRLNAANDLERLIIDKPSGTAIIQGGGAGNPLNCEIYEHKSGELRLSSSTPLEIDRDATLTGGLFTFADSRVRARGNWINTGTTIQSGNATALMEFFPANTTTKTIQNNGQSFNQIVFLTGGPALTQYNIVDNLSAVDLTTIQNNRRVNTVAGTNVQLRLTGLIVRNGGTLDLNDASELLMQSDPTKTPNAATLSYRTLLVEAGGRLEMIGTTSSFVTISRQGNAYYKFDIDGQISARYFTIQFVNFEGVDLKGGSSLSPGNIQYGCAPGPVTVVPVGSFSDGIFTNGEDLANGTYLNLPNAYISDTIYNASFPLPLTAANTSNVWRQNGGSTQLTKFKDATGSYAGELYDREDNTPAILATLAAPTADGHIRWVNLVKYWDGRNNAGVATGNTNWNDARNWTGDALPSTTQDVIFNYQAIRNLGAAFGAGTTPSLFSGYTVTIDANSITCRNLSIDTEFDPEIAGSNPQPITLMLINGGDLTVQGALSPCTGQIVGGDLTATTAAEIYTEDDNSDIKVGKTWSNAGVFTAGDANGDNNKGLVEFNQAVGTRVISTAPNYSPFWNVTFSAGNTLINSLLNVDNDLIITGANTILDASGRITDNEIRIAGNWINIDGEFKPRVGTVSFIGSNTPQTIQRTNVSPTKQAELFYNMRLEKDNPTDMVQLNSRAIIDDGGRLTLVRGKIASATNNELILKETADWLRDVSWTVDPNIQNSTAFVDGPVGAIFSSSTATLTHSYPIGKTGVPYAGEDFGGSSDGYSLAIRLTNNNPTAFTMEQFNGDAEDANGDGVTDAPGARTLPSGINMLSKDLYWQVKNIEFPSTTALAGNIAEATIGIPFRASNNPLDTLVNGTPYSAFDNTLVDQLSLLQDYIAPTYDANLTNPNTGTVSTAAKRGTAAKGTSWRDLGGTTDIASDNVTITSQLNFNTLGNAQFVFGWFFAPLPVEILDIQAVANANTVDISWITASEKNSDKFIIERSENARDFQAIGNVKAQGFSSSLKNYRFTDLNPKVGINYYRLQQVDLDGSVNYSKVVAVNIASTGAAAANEISLYPNPSKGGDFYVKAMVEAGEEVGITITDLMGKVTYQANIIAEKELVYVKPYTNLSKGIYIVTLVTKTGNYQKQLVVL